MRFIYLHGFASSPRSRKALAFEAALGACRITMEIPLLDGNDFEHLTIAGQLQIIEEQLAGQPACLIGSSMGGYLAALYAAKHREIEKLVLMAPAFAFSTRWEHLAGPEKLAEWRDTGSLEIFHYGEQQLRRVHYALYQEALALPPFPDVLQPTLIFHGIHDDIVPAGLSREFAAAKPSVTLREVDSGHELLNVLDFVLAEACAFLI